MHRAFNLILVITALAAGFVLYSLEHRMRAGERTIARLNNEIIEEREIVRLLHAEWSFLTRPARLERLARDHAGMKPMQSWQVVEETELGRRLPDRPPPNPAESPDDPLAELLRVLR